MVKDVYYGKTLRKSFARHEEVLEMPNLLEIQKKSYQWFLDTGLREVGSQLRVRVQKSEIIRQQASVFLLICICDRFDPVVNS